MIQRYPPLESYPKRVLAEYIRRTSWSPQEMERIAEEQRRENRTIVLPGCCYCKDAGVTFINGAGLIRWCNCAAMERLKKKEPDFVERWNVHRQGEQLLEPAQKMLRGE